MHKSNLETIYEEKIKKTNLINTFENKIMLLNEFYDIKNIDDNSLYISKKSKSNLGEINVEEYNKICYKSDDEENIHKKKNLIDEEEE